MTEANKAVNAVVVSFLNTALASAPGTDHKAILAGVAVDTFINVTSYENNRDVAERAAKQAKTESEHRNGDQVAIVMLDPVLNSALWERTKRLAAERNEAHTLPFIKADGHTRAYGWSHVKTNKTVEVGVNPATQLFTRPDSLFVTVHKGLTDEQIFALVKEYCDGVSKANNRELQQMGMKRIEFTPTSDFVAKDSWKTAFRTIDRKHGKEVDSALEFFRDSLEAIDALKVETKNTTKKLSGVRAAMLTTHQMKSGAKWKGFWSMFFSVKTKQAQIVDLLAELGELGTGDNAKALELCEDAFKEFAGLVPVIVEEPAQEQAA